MNLLKEWKKKGYTIKVGSLGNYFIFNNKNEFVCADTGYRLKYMEVKYND